MTSSCYWREIEEEMCLKKLEIRLAGYEDGAMLLFRGTEINHYVTPWNWAEDDYRYAFDHTTHESIRQAVLNKKSYPDYEQPKFLEDDPNYKPDPKGPDSKKPDSNKEDEPNDGYNREVSIKKKKSKNATVKKSAAKSAPRKKTPTKKAKDKSKAKADTLNELGDNPAFDTFLGDDEVVEPPHKPTKPKKRPVTDVSDDKNSENPTSKSKRPRTAHINKNEKSTTQKKRSATEISDDDDDDENPKSMTKPAKRARTNKKGNAVNELSVRRSERARWKVLPR